MAPLTFESLPFWALVVAVTANSEISRATARDRSALQFPVCRRPLMIPIPAVVAIIVVLYVLSSIKILREYERGVIFRQGRLLLYAKGPGHGTSDTKRI